MFYRLMSQLADLNIQTSVGMLALYDVYVAVATDLMCFVYTGRLYFLT